jgi:hypothetical protein
LAQEKGRASVDEEGFIIVIYKKKNKIKKKRKDFNQHRNI